MPQSLFPAIIPFDVLGQAAKKAIAGEVDLELAQMAAYAVGCGLAYMEANELTTLINQINEPSRTFTSQSPRAIGESLSSELAAMGQPVQSGVVTADDVQKMDPATLLLIFTAVSNLLKLFIRR